MSTFWLILCFIFNYIVDPHGENKKLLREGFNKHKAVVDERLIKFEEISKNNKSYQAYIFGSSSSTVLSPEKVKEISGFNTYNASFSSATSDEYFKYIEFILKQKNNVRLIIIGIDLFAYSDLFKSNGQMPTSFVEKGKSGYEFLNYLSFDYLKKSFKVIYFNIMNRNPDITFTRDGMRIYNTYLTRNESNLENYLNEKVIKGKAKWHKIKKISKERLQWLKKIKKMTDEQGIELILFTTPLFYQYLDDTTKNEYSLQIDLIKKIVNEVGGLYEFSFDYNLTKNPRNFIDKAHYSYKAADNITERILGREGPWGKLLDRNNVNSFIESLPPARNN